MTAFAQDQDRQADIDLAQRYAPVLYFHPAELFRPQSVDVLTNTARLRQRRRLWFDVNVLQQVSIEDLLHYRDSSFFLDAWYGNEGASDNKNYSAHCSYYQTVLSPEAGGPPIVTYAHVARGEGSEHVTIQYWLFYYFNDWFNKHEGDWEMIQVVLSSEGEPAWVVLSQHHGGTRRPWSAMRIEAGTHPAVFVALGSHANYFRGDEIYLSVQDIGNAQIMIADRTGTSDRIIPEVILIPDRDEVDEDPTGWQGFEWILFEGHWGETAPQSDFGGPFGPADKGRQWEEPYAWGMSQPLDKDVWFSNRLRVEITGDGAQGAQVSLRTANGDPLPSAESLGNVALLHTDPPTNVGIVADIAVTSTLAFGVHAVWPEPESSQVIHYFFDDVVLNPSGRLTLSLQADHPPRLASAGGPAKMELTRIEIESVPWDAPDLVWVAGVLPASDVLKGVMIGLLAGVLPALLYVAILYWVDRYEKEPFHLLAATFLWGALPAILITVTVRLFFRLPADMMGPEMIEAVWSGLAAPLIEETLKGLVIVFIAVRYRREFDNVLDGIIYGAMVGLGFAMTANMLSYIGAFLLRGFAGLGSTIFIEGVLYGLNHAFYSAIFGAGLGYARLVQKRWQRWSAPIVSFSLAVFVHSVHNLAIRKAIGLSPLTVAATWVGILVIVVVMAWAVRRERRCLETELINTIPGPLYRTLMKPRGRLREQWLALRNEGFRGWQKTRRLHQLCAEFAFKRMQARLFPDELEIAAEAKDVLREIKVLCEAAPH